MITKQLLEKTEPFSIMVSGIEYDTEDGINFCGTGNLMKWVAVRGGAPDWAMYAEQHSRGSFEHIAQYGIKLSKSEAMKLVVADEESWDKYRR